MQLASLKGHQSVVQLLIENGANFSLTDNFRNTHLHCAAVCGHKSVVSIANVDDGKSSFLSVDLLAKAMQSEEQDRLIFLAFILKPLGLPILVVYTIYLSIVQHQRWMVPLQRAWNILKTIKGDR